MLVLKVSRGGSLMVGNAEVRVLGVSGNTVRVGVEAPREIAVRRVPAAERPGSRPSAAAAGVAGN